jgi:hypothetical protein
MLVDKVNTWLFYTFTQHVGAWNWCFMSANTSPKLELLLVLEQSRAWSNARYSRQHKCRPMLKLTKWINTVIPCGPYLPHGAFCGIFLTLSWAVERWNLSAVSLLLSLFLKLIGENMVTKIIWFLNLRHLGTLFGVCFLTSAQQILLFHPTL